MTTRLYNYLSPIILPVFPEQTGKLWVTTDVQRVLQSRAIADASGTLTVNYSIYCDGKCESVDEDQYDIHNASLRSEQNWRQFSATAAGYLEISFNCDSPIFWKILPDVGYSLLVTPQGNQLTVNGDMKYASPRIIDQIRGTGMFCMLHAAARVDQKKRSGNSILLVNPYDQTILVKATAEHAEPIRTPVRPRSAVIQDLAALFPVAGMKTLMITGNNRIITYDIRHPYGIPLAPNSIDHLDPYSGMGTHITGTPSQWARAMIRMALRKAGLRYA